MDTTRADIRPTMPAPGAVLGPYALFGVLGEGGAAVVYDALDPAGRPVALKVLRPEHAADPVRLAEFRAEAALTAAARHENVVAVLDAGTAHGLSYIALENLGGRGVTDILEYGRGLPWRRAARIVAEICSALRRAHERGIVHCDVKPENLLLRPDGRACLSDFGIARRLGSGGEPAVPPRSAGTAAYASPEQCLGKPLGPATDMYSLGATFYALLTGRPPFGGRSRSEVVRRNVREAPPPLAVLRPDLPPALVRLVERMMAKRPADRVPDMRRLAAHLRTLLAGKAEGALPLAKAG